MTNVQKNKPCTSAIFESEFQDTTRPQQEHANFMRALTPPPTTQSLPERWKHCVAFFKCVVETGTFSLPTYLFQEWCAYDGQVVDGADVLLDPIEQILNVASAPPIVPGNDDISVFRVINATPETRGHMNIAHASRARTCVVVAPCLVVATRTVDTVQLVIKESTDHKRLDVAFLIPHMDRCMALMQRWQPVAVRTTATPRAQALMPISDADSDSLLPPDLGAPRSSVLARSAAPCTTLALPEERDLSLGAVRALSQLVDFGGMLGPVASSKLVGVSDAVLQELAQHHMVALQDASDDGQRAVALQANTVSLDALLLIARPAQAMRMLSGKKHYNFHGYTILFGLLRLAGLRLRRWAIRTRPRVRCSILRMTTGRCHTSPRFPLR